MMMMFMMMVICMMFLIMMVIVTVKKNQTQVKLEVKYLKEVTPYFLKVQLLHYLYLLTLYLQGVFFTLGLPLKVQSIEKLI